MGCKLLLIAQFHEVDLETSAQARLDAFREAVQPGSNYDLTLYRPTEAELEAMGYVPKNRATRPALSQDILDAINWLLDGSWGDEVERYNEDGRPAGHNFESLAALENLLRGTSKTAAEFADEALADD